MSIFGSIITESTIFGKLIQLLKCQPISEPSRGELLELAAGVVPTAGADGEGRISGLPMEAAR